MTLLAKITRDQQGAETVTGGAITWAGTTNSADAPYNQAGTAFDMNADGLAHVVVDALNFDVLDHFSIAFWLYLEGVPDSFANYISRQEGGGDFDGWAIATGGSGAREKLGFNLRQDASNNFTVESVEDIPTAEWVHVVVTYSGNPAAGGVRMFFNGREVATTATATTLSTAEDPTTAAGVPFTLGGRDAVAASPGVNYLLDEVEVHSGTLTPQDAARIYERAAPSTRWELALCEDYLTAVSSNDWLGRSDLIELASGTWLHFFRASTSHSSAAAANWHLRASEDQGASWTPNDTTLDGASVTGTPITVINTDDSPHDLTLAQAANGDVLAFVSYYDGNRHGTHLWRSDDDGETWADDGQISITGIDDDGIVAGGQAVVIDGTIYFATTYDPTPAGAGNLQSVVIKSTDDGATWSLHCYLSELTDNTSETCLIHLGSGKMLAILRDNASATTHQVTVTTDGTVGRLKDITSVVGVLQRPKLFHLGDSLLLSCRKLVGSDQWSTFFVSDDDGYSWGDSLLLEPLGYEDCGYIGLVITGDRVRGFTYRGTNDATQLVKFELRNKGGSLATRQAAMVGKLVELEPTEIEAWSHANDNGTTFDLNGQTYGQIGGLLPLAKQ